jgi:hypothetical protein
MFRKAIILGMAFLALPSIVLAQHGGGGGHIGGATAGGGSMTGGGRATGVENKDDLRDFHQIMAVQASSEQKTAFAAMVKTTLIAMAELQSFTKQLGRESNAPELANRDKSLAETLETARTLNKKFLEGFSEPQKSGLKEMTKRLGKADSELAQQARALDQAFEANAGAPQMTNAAQGLERELASFQRTQLQLGEEMSIQAPSTNQGIAFNLLPLTNTVKFGDQTIDIHVSGVVSNAATEGTQNNFSVKLTADLWDLQQNITGVVRDELNKADRCGEQVTIQTATLVPQEPAGVVVAQLHYERWTCSTLLGREASNELTEGNATIEVRLIPAVAEDGTLRLTGEIARINAEGLLGELLRSGTLGEALRDKVTESVLTIMRQGDDFKSSLPNEARNYASLRRARFEGTGSGRLRAVLDGDMVVSNENLTAVSNGLKQRSSPAPDRSLAQPELLTR